MTNAVQHGRRHPGPRKRGTNWDYAYPSLTAPQIVRRLVEDRKYEDAVRYARRHHLRLPDVERVYIGPRKVPAKPRTRRSGFWGWLFGS